MSVFEILSTLLIGPLKLIFEYIFAFAYKFTSHAGVSVVVLSVIMNFLLLPLYRRTDAIQEEARDTEEKLREGVTHIKKSFSGDERMMLLQTYYRQNNYRPTDSLKGSVSLMLEIPFFMAAYQFLSDLVVLKGASLGPVADLSSPDALIVLGGLTLNALPIIMTVVNVVSSSLYLKGFPLKSKIQLYAMALFFLVFLYNSPSGLVLYWTMNNLFSLIKTLFCKLKHPLKVISVGSSAAGIGIWYYAFFLYSNQSAKVKVAAVALGALLQLPLLWMLFGKKLQARLPETKPQSDRKIFLLGGLFLTALTGLLIPSTFIAASPQEFVDVTYYYNPLWYLVSSGCLAAGTFLVWLNVFYWLANERAKSWLDKLVWILSGVMIVNYMFFGTDLGIISAALQYEKAMIFTRGEQLTNIAVILAVAVVLLVVIVKWRRTVTLVLLTASIALTSMSVIHIATISGSLKDLNHLSGEKNDLQPHFTLSTEGNNVVVIMLDCAMGQYIPYIMQERPELQRQFAGFTYYANTISFGGYTNFGTPALFGGYEYTPVEMNRRDSEPLASKQNEALRLMPVNFTENGYNTTVCDPPYANYQWISDLSIYDDHPDINAYITKGKFGDVTYKKAKVQNLHRNFFCFSIMKSMPLMVQPAIYNAGVYNHMNSLGKQIYHSMSVAEGQDSGFMDSFGTLQNLHQLSRIARDGSDNFLLLVNDTTHDPMILKEPEYLPADYVDNTAYDEAHKDRFTVDGRTIDMSVAGQMKHYQSDMAAYIQLGKWFDYLREQGVYDNTRIILVSDHGAMLFHLEQMLLDDGTGSHIDVEHYFPLLMVKDFGAQTFTVSHEFMTNADVPTLAMEDLIAEPVNPATGKPVTNDEKYAHDQMIIVSNEWSTVINSGNTFLPARWAAVKDSIWEADNWSFSQEKTVLTEHRLP